MKYHCIFFAGCPPFLLVNNSYICLSLPSHQLSRMRFTEKQWHPCACLADVIYTQLCLHLLPGMGIPTVTAARILKGQLAGRSGEETSLFMDSFPHLALSKVGPH